MKMKDVDKRLKTSAVLIAVTLLVSFTSIISYNIGLAELQGSVEEVPFYVGAPLPYYAIVDRNSTMAWMWNGTTGQQQFTSVNDDLVIQSAIDNVTTVEGTVYVKAGTYTASVTLKDNVDLILEEGCSGVNVAVDAGADCTFMDLELGFTKEYVSGSLYSFIDYRGGQLWYGGENRTDFYDKTVSAEIEGKFPYTYLIFENSTAYYMVNGTTGDIDFYNTNATTLIQNAIDNCTDGSTLFFAEGDYGDAVGGYLNLDVNDLRGLRFVGSGRGNDNVPTGGTVFNIAANGGIDISHSSDETFHTYFCDITFSAGGRAGAKGIHSDGQPTDEKVSQWVFERLYFTGFTGASSIAIDITSHESGVIRDCDFNGAPSGGTSILLESNDYFAGNCVVDNCRWWVNGGQTNSHFITILTSDAKENDFYVFTNNQIFARDYPNYFLHLNAASGSIKQVRLFNNRMEYACLIKCSGSSSIPDLIAVGNHVDMGTNLDVGIEMTTQARSWIITDNTFPCSAGRTSISDASNQASYPSLIADNTFYTAGTFYNPSGSPPTEVRDNKGFVTEKVGQAEASNDDYVAHGLSGTPDYVLFTMVETDANYVVQLKTANSTHFQVYLYDLDAAGVEGTDKTINWIAFYVP